MVTLDLVGSEYPHRDKPGRRGNTASAINVIATPELNMSIMSITSDLPR